VKRRLGGFVERVRGRRWARWPALVRGDADRVKSLPPEDTGWTVHRDVALRLQNLGIAEGSTPPDEPAMATDAFKIRLAGAPEARRDAESLVRQRYARRGYRASATLLNANVCTFTAYDEGRLAGTVSLRLDSPEGLAADELYRAEIDALRHEGRRICEFTRLAVDTTRGSPPVLAGLFHTVFLFARTLRGFDFVVIEVNPRHVGFYRRALGFDVIGAERHNPRVKAPAVLMGVSFRSIGESLRRSAGKGGRAATARNLYAYGFSPAEEAGILGRLRALDRRT
jgi:hypothetical protein